MLHRVSQRDVFKRNTDAPGNPVITALRRVTAAPRMLKQEIDSDTVDEYTRLSETSVLISMRPFCKSVIEEFGA